MGNDSRGLPVPAQLPPPHVDALRRCLKGVPGASGWLFCPLLVTSALEIDAPFSHKNLKGNKNPPAGTPTLTPPTAQRRMPPLLFSFREVYACCRCGGRHGSPGVAQARQPRRRGRPQAGQAAQAERPFPGTQVQRPSEDEGFDRLRYPLVSGPSPPCEQRAL